MPGLITDIAQRMGAPPGLLVILLLILLAPIVIIAYNMLKPPRSPRNDEDS